MPLPPKGPNCVSATIKKLMDEGYSAKQAAAIAYQNCGDGKP